MRLALTLAGVLLTASARADVIFDDGQTHLLTMRVDDNVQVFDGPSRPTTLVVQPATFNAQHTFIYNLSVHGSSSATLNAFEPLLAYSLFADGNATLAVNGGADAVGVTASGNAHVTLRGINLHPLVGFALNVSDNAHMDIFALSASFASPPVSIDVTGNGTATVYGTNFNVGYGPLPFDAGTVEGMIGGVHVHLEVAGGGHNITLASLTPVPEPASLALLGTGAAVLAVSRVRSRRKR